MSKSCCLKSMTAKGGASLSNFLPSLVLNGTLANCKSTQHLSR